MKRRGERREKTEGIKCVRILRRNELGSVEEPKNGCVGRGPRGKWT